MQEQKTILETRFKENLVGMGADSTDFMLFARDTAKLHAQCLLKTAIVLEDQLWTLQLDKKKKEEINALKRE